jgi:hypothetical protein
MKTHTWILFCVVTLLFGCTTNDPTPRTQSKSGDQTKPQPGNGTFGGSGSINTGAGTVGR